MKRYIALLRGINISGKNKISMEQLKLCFINLGYEDVKTYLNSGNVLFSTNECDEIVLVDYIKTSIKKETGLEIPVFIILQSKLKELLNNAPVWWCTNNKNIYSNLIFILSPFKAETVIDKIGIPTEKIEQILLYENVIFWSFDRINYTKSNWWKQTAKTGIGEMITIRTANTLNKLVY